MIFKWGTVLLLSINASLFPEYCRIENYIHVVRSATLHLQLKIKTFQKCTVKNKEVEIMEGWCLSSPRFLCRLTALIRKVSMEPELTRVYGRLFQSLMVLGKKEY
jgi:hypothetical protein